MTAMFHYLTHFWQEWGELVTQLTKREIKARYKQSFLGYAWVILVPLINLAVLTVVFSLFFRINTGEIPYPLFLFTGLVPWTFTATAITAATASLVANANLITKIRLPRSIFPLSAILVKVVDLALSALVLLILIFVLGERIYPTILWVPFIFIVQLVMVFGLSLTLAAVNVFYRDVENVLGVFLMVWMYLTPVIYPPEMIPPQLRTLFNLNPMTGIINAYRNTILHGVNPPWESFLYAIAISILLFVGGAYFFRRTSRYFADVI